MTDVCFAKAESVRLFGPKKGCDFTVHYFTDNRSLPSNRKEHSFWLKDREYTFATDDGVFSKTGVDYGTRVLLEYLSQEKWSGFLLDLGCGYGVIGIVLKTLNPDLEVTCSDRNPRAVELTGINSNTNHAPVTAIVSDCFENLPGKYQAIVTNPPIRAGKKIVYGMFQGAWDHLEPGGKFAAVVRRQQGAESAAAEIERIFGSCETAVRDRGYWVLTSMKQV